MKSNCTKRRIRRNPEALERFVGTRIAKSLDEDLGYPERTYGHDVSLFGVPAEQSPLRASRGCHRRVRAETPRDLWVDDDPIEIARDRGYTEMEQLLAHTFETKFNASPKGEPVALSLRNHDLKQMNELLDAQPELVGKGDRRSNQPIHWATMTRQLDAIDELLPRGADINARRIDGARPIHLTNGDYFYRGWRDVPRNWPVTAAHVMAHLKARGASVDLPTACHTGDIERVRELLQQDPSLANQIGQHAVHYLGAGSPLSNAAAVGRLDIVELLLDHGADPNLAEEQITPKGKALYSAVYHGHYDIAKLLLERGAFPNPPVESSGDALWVSQEWRPDKRMEQLLLSHGAKPTKGHRGKTRHRRRKTGCASRRCTRRHARRRARSEEAAGRWRRSDRARRAPPLDAARLGREIRARRDGQLPAATRRPEKLAGRSGMGHGARVGA